MGLIFFCLPAMFNVINGLGGGGKVDKNVSATANIAINVTFALFGLFGGATVNLLGPKWTMAISGLGYAFYVSSFLIWNHTATSWPVILGGAILGICAGSLWTCQGMVVMSYATEQEKGTFFYLFWVIFNLGAIFGNFLIFGLTYNITDALELGDGAYIAILVVMLIGCGMCFFLVPIDQMVRSDGSKVQIEKVSNVMTNSIKIVKLFFDWRMLALFPMFLSSNWFYTYQFDDYNSAVFNVRTRAFNSVFYWGSQVLGAMVFGILLDSPRWNRRTRAFYAVSLMCILFTAVWVGGYFFQRTYERYYPVDKNDFVTKDVNPYMFGDPKHTPDNYKVGIDFLESALYIGPFILYFFYGFMDAVVQSLSFWFLGALSNDPNVLAIYSGYYKGVQSAGNALAWYVSTTKATYTTQLIICWVLVEVSVPLALLVARVIPDTNMTDADFEHELDKKVEA
jgi:MFS family permease